MTTFALTGYALYDALTNVLPHTSGDDTLPVLNAVRVEVADDGLVTFVATDRHTIGVVEVASNPQRELEPGVFSIPAVNVRDIAKNAKTMRGGCVTVVHAAPGIVTTTLDTGEMSSCRDQIGEFPKKWRALFPTADVSPVAVDRIGLNADDLAKFGKLVIDGRHKKNATLACTSYGATKPVVVDVDLGYSDLTMRALVMPVRLASS